MFESPGERRHDRDRNALDRLADLAETEGARRGVKFFGIAMGVQMIIGIVISIVALVFFIIIAVKILGSSDDPNFGGLGGVQITQR